MDGALGAIHGGQHAVAIQFDEGALFELGEGVSDRAAGERLKDLSWSQVLEKLVQMALEGLDGFLEDEKHEDRESQLAVAGEVLRSHAMASQEVWVVQFGAECFDEGEKIFRNSVQNVSHPHANSGVAEFVQSKCLTFNDLHTNSTAVLPSPLPTRASRGEGELVQRNYFVYTK